MNASLAYSVLNIKNDATFEQVKEAYRKLALIHHPDKNHIQKDGERFKQISEAYNFFKQQEKEGVFGKKNIKNNYTSTKTRRNFEHVNPDWGAPEWTKPPEQDWGKYTREFEQEDPEWWKQYEKNFWEKYNESINRRGNRGEFDKASGPENPPNILVNVDPSLCIGCCSCEIIAPEVFLVDKLRNNPKSKVINQKGAGYNRIMNAAQTCPTKAIMVDNEELKERIYPL